MAESEENDLESDNGKQCMIDEHWGDVRRLFVSDSCCCEKFQGFILFVVLGILLFSLCSAAILGDPYNGILPPISSTGSYICLGISAFCVLFLIVYCLCVLP
jgi:hypothetical protein